MSTEVTPESLRAHAEWLRDDALTRDNTWAALEAMKILLAKADRLEREQRPLPTEPGWYPGIVVERGGESCTGALHCDDRRWATLRSVGGRYAHLVRDREPIVRWAERDGTTPGQTVYEVWSKPYGFFPWSGISSAVRDRYERAANAVLSAHGTPTLTPVGEHPEQGTRGLLPVVLVDSGIWRSTTGWLVSGEYQGRKQEILADPRPDGAHE